MKTQNGSWKSSKSLLPLVAVSMFCYAAPSAAVSLYWGKTPTHTASLKTCLSFANQGMSELHYQHIRVSRDEVAGQGNGAYAAVTCVGTKPATAVIMVAGEDGGATSAARDQLQRFIAGITNID